MAGVPTCHGNSSSNKHLQLKWGIPDNHSCTLDRFLTCFKLLLKMLHCMALVLGKAEGAFQLYMQIQIEVGLHCMQLNGNTVGFPNQKQKGTATKMLSRQRAQLYTRSMIPPAPILQLQPWRYHTSFFFFFTQVLLKHYSIDVAPTAHAYDTHSYRFVVFQILLVAFHAQICQPSSN